MTLRKTISKQLKSKRGFTPLEKVYPVTKFFSNGIKKLSSLTGFTLLEVMVCATVLVIATTTSLQIYLQTAYIVEDAKERTIAMTHNKIVMEEIRSWSVLDDAEIASCKSYQGGWRSWLQDKVGQGSLLPEETIEVGSQDWISNFPTSPRRVVVATTWDGVKGAREMLLVGGFI